MTDLHIRNIQRCDVCNLVFWLIPFPLFARLIQGQAITELFPKQVRMNRHMELKFQIECLQDVAVVNCSGRMVRGAALDEFRRRIEQLERIRVLVLDVSDVDHLDAGGLGTLLLVRRWATRNSVKVKLVNPPVFFRRLLEATHLTSVFEISSLKEALCILRAKECPPRFAVA
jgi:anti-anti-sigma factor